MTISQVVQRDHWIFIREKAEALMKVVTAKTAGFCFGVQRAVDKVYELIEPENVAPIYTLWTDHP